MPIRLSTGLRNGMLGASGFKELFTNGYIEIRDGPQPASADDAATGTLLGTVSPEDGILGVAATNTVTSDNTNVSNNDTVTVNGKVYTFKTALSPAEGEVLIGADADGSLTNLAHAINGTGGTNGTDYKVAAANAYVSAGAVTAHAITLTARAIGVQGNVITLAEGSSHLSVGGATFSGGVTAVGLTFEEPDAGVIAKKIGEAWNFTGLANGIAGWFRLKGNATDSGSSTTLPRMDGSIATSGGNMGMVNVQVELDQPNAITRFRFRLPAS